MHAIIINGQTIALDGRDIDLIMRAIECERARQCTVLATSPEGTVRHASRTLHVQDLSDLSARLYALGRPADGTSRV